MKNQIVFTVLAALIGGAIGAVLTQAGQASGTTADGDQVLEIAALEDRLTDLAEQNELLLQRLKSIEERPVLSTPVRTDVAPVTEADPRTEELAAMMEELKSSSSPTLTANFRSEVGNVLKDIRAQEERERDERREKAQEERAERNLAKLAEELNLDPYQTNKMREALTKQNDLMQLARESMREAGDWEGMRDAMGNIREETTQMLGTFLTPAQLEQYGESRYSNPFGGRGGRGGGDGGGDGGRRGRGR